MIVAPISLVVMTENVPRHCQMSLGGQNDVYLRTIVLEEGEGKLDSRAIQVRGLKRGTRGIAQHAQGRKLRDF